MRVPPGCGRIAITSRIIDICPGAMARDRRPPQPRPIRRLGPARPVAPDAPIAGGVGRRVYRLPAPRRCPGSGRPPGGLAGVGRCRRCHCVGPSVVARNPRPPPGGTGPPGVPAGLRRRTHRRPDLLPRPARASQAHCTTGVAGFGHVHSRLRDRRRGHGDGGGDRRWDPRRSLSRQGGARVVDRDVRRTSRLFPRRLLRRPADGLPLGCVVLGCRRLGVRRILHPVARIRPLSWAGR